MPTKPKPKSKPKSKPKPNVKKTKTAKPLVKSEKAVSAELSISGKQGSGLLLAMALRPAPTVAQLDARQQAAKTKRKASGPARKGTALSKIKAPEVPPVNPRNK